MSSSVISIIRSMTLAESGIKKIEWAKSHMPILNCIHSEFIECKPFQGLRIGVCIHLEAKTAYLCQVLADGGAEVFVAGSNPLSTQDDIAAGLITHDNIHVFAVHGCSQGEYEDYLKMVLDNNCNIIIDDGGDLVNLLHTEMTDKLKYVIGGCEETTTGIHRLKRLKEDKKLKFPMVAVNDADCKHLFDNRYGTGQSVWTAIDSATNLIVAGKTVVVAGYGWCGKGVAMRAKGLGANIIITEVDPIKAIEAYMDGFRVCPMSDAAKIGDIFITVTGCKDVITLSEMLKMKDGAIVCNAGHFDVEVRVDQLDCFAHKEVRSGVERYDISVPYRSDIRSIYVLSEGRLVNLAAGDGHPAEIMDMSFAIQALSAEYLVMNYKLNSKCGEVISVPRSIDNQVAMLKLRSLGIQIDCLSVDQQQYLNIQS